MKPKDIKTFYRQNLPHIQPIGATFFVTFRLKDSIPAAKLYQLKQEHENTLAQLEHKTPSILARLKNEEQKRYFRRYDSLLDSIKTGPHYLKQPEIAQIVKNELHRFDGSLYDLITYCIMSNHVHILIDTSIQIPEDIDQLNFETMDFEPLHNIMKRIKGPTVIYANRFLDRKGKFWQRESYDRYIRDEKEFWNTAAYILDNPVKAGIVEEWMNFPYSYLKGFGIKPGK